MLVDTDVDEGRAMHTGSQTRSPSSPSRAASGGRASQASSPRRHARHHSGRHRSTTSAGERRRPGRGPSRGRYGRARGRGAQDATSTTWSARTSASGSPSVRECSGRLEPGLGVNRPGIRGGSGMPWESPATETSKRRPGHGHEGGPFGGGTPPRVRSCMTLTWVRRSVHALASATLALGALAACAGGGEAGSPDEARVAAIYGAVILAFADGHTADQPLPAVFVAPRPDAKPIPLSVQAAVVDELASNVRSVSSTTTTRPSIARSTAAP